MSDWIHFFVFGWGMPFTIYVLLQVIVVLTVRGKYRLLVTAPALLGVIIVVWTIRSYQQGANLWPFCLMYGGPLATVLLIAVWVGAIFARRAERRGINGS